MKSTAIALRVSRVGFAILDRLRFLLASSHEGFMQQSEPLHGEYRHDLIGSRGSSAKHGFPCSPPASPHALSLRSALCPPWRTPV